MQGLRLKHFVPCPSGSALSGLLYSAAGEGRALVVTVFLKNQGSRSKAPVQSYASLPQSGKQMQAKLLMSDFSGTNQHCAE